MSARSPLYDILAPIDTRRMTTADVAEILGCNIDRAGEMMRKLGKDFIRREGGFGHGPYATDDGPKPLIGDTEAHWRHLLSGRSYGDHSRAAPPQPIARQSGPELTHTAGGVGW